MVSRWSVDPEHEPKAVCDQSKEEVWQGVWERHSGREITNMTDEMLVLG